MREARLVLDSELQDAVARLNGAIYRSMEARERVRDEEPAASCSPEMAPPAALFDTEVCSSESGEDEYGVDEALHTGSDLDEELQLAERVARTEQAVNLAPICVLTHCVECGRSWREPESRMRPARFMCDYCDEDRDHSWFAAAEDLWDMVAD